MGDRDQPMSQWPSTHRFVIPVADGPDEVTVTIDGREVTAPRGELLIRVAQDHGTYIPRFCYHERMKPVGMCRMCLVEVEGMRGFQISCATPVTDGMVVRTASDDVKRVQDGVLEFLLDQPPARLSGVRPRRRVPAPGPDARVRSRRVALRRGEAPLHQADPDQRAGAPRPRALHPVRPVHPLRSRDRRRPAHRLRRSRRGDRGHHLPGRALHVVLLRQRRPDLPGRARSRRSRTGSRPGRGTSPSAETSCTTCAVGCRGALDSSSNRLLRLLGVDSEPINHGWLCDKGRFSYEHVHSWRRVRNPMIRKEGEMVECSWPEALDAAAAGAARPRSTQQGAGSVALLGGARGTNEDAYLWAKLAKAVLGTDHVDAQLGDGLPAETVLGLPGATIADCDRAGRDRAPRPRPQGGAAGARAPPQARRRRSRCPRSSTSPPATTG